MQHARPFILVLLALLVATAPSARAVTIATLGDSYSDEYAIKSTRNNHRNWIEQLAAVGSVNFGNPSGNPTQYQYNFALSGATTNDALLTQLPSLLGPNNDDPGHSNLFFADYVVIDIGLNDYHGLTGGSPMTPQTYIDIGNANAAVTAATIGGFGPGEGGILGNIKSLIDIIRAADPGKRIVLANIADWRATRPFRQARIDTAFDIDFTGTGGSDNALLRQQVYFTIRQANADLAAYANSIGIPVVNKFLLLNKAAKRSIPLTMEDRIEFKNEPDITGIQGGAYDLWADGLHPGTAFNGLYANAIIAALNGYYGEELDYLTSQQIIAGYLGAADLPTLPLHSAWDFSRYVIAPEIPLALTPALSLDAIPEPTSALSLLTAGALLSMCQGRDVAIPHRC
ncbi:MAG: SGNH/GDSL hydrolase family protein [Phycisphaeraceae bacterium]|nr:SGNH/GDSL hydrolase family protein [Phycisphaeraceae bacterium]